MRLALWLALMVVLCGSGTANAQALACNTNQKNAAVVEMMFGRKIGDRIGVSNAAWTRFLDREVSPRFPDGLTVVDALGQWRDTDRNRVIREPSKIVTIVLRDAAQGQDKIDAIVAAYKQRFRQQAVGVIVRPACVAF